ncbi:MAG: hypothetical protein PHS14_09315 [Elusimicrobia bacterium]|nr:hypothetical protein [Elusimicrobiota bacterium]
MRTMMKVTLPVEAGNRAIGDGTLPKMIQDLIDANKPEASYFYTENGKRGMMFVFDMKEPSQIPAISEPLFMNLHAEVVYYPVMNAADLKIGLEKVVGRKHGRAPVEV